MTYLELMLELRELATAVYADFRQFPDKNELTQCLFPSLFYVPGTTNVDFKSGFYETSMTLYSLDVTPQGEALPEQTYSEQLTILSCFVNNLRKMFPLVTATFSECNFEGLDHLGGCLCNLTIRWKYDLCEDDFRNLRITHYLTLNHEVYGRLNENRLAPNGLPDHYLTINHIKYGRLDENPLAPKGLGTMG